MTETPTLNVVPLRSAPPLTDLAAQLRQLAAWIEHETDRPEGDYGNVREAYVVLFKAGEMRPIFHAWGEVADRHGIAGRFLHAAQLALTDRSD